MGTLTETQLKLAAVRYCEVMGINATDPDEFKRVLEELQNYQRSLESVQSDVRRYRAMREAIEWAVTQ